MNYLKKKSENAINNYYNTIQVVDSNDTSYL